MQDSQNPKNASSEIPMGELLSYHQKMAEKYKDTDPLQVTTSPDLLALMIFNGYYSMDNTPGAFFTVDTNIHIQNGSSTPIYDLALIICMDGKTSYRVPFTGTFDGTHLIQTGTAANTFGISLTFTHSGQQNGTTASFSGSITPYGGTPVTVTGKTYNNPIPYAQYIGEYYETVPLHLSPSKTTKTMLPVMKIEDNYQISYDITGNGTLSTVGSFSYNLNMYFFSFTEGNNSISLIMGTAAAGGFACNNMTVNNTSHTVVSRSLQTIPFPVMASNEIPSLTPGAAKDLAQFSGYYSLPSIAPLAFISIEAQYINGLGDDYVVMIGVSLDGVTSQGFYFDTTMSFVENKLTMPNQAITLTFNKAYDPANRSLASVAGTVMGHNNVTGYTLFNPVPLSAFGGVPMTNKQGVKLTVVNDNEVVYAGTQITTPMKSILYVPIMYILAYPSTNPTTVMSFGTDGKRGNTCIITDNNGIYVTYAIPNESAN
ncbi:hypothetical protein AWW67_18025 [Roseivirga seohaensis]|uniref:Uncharacterized protein n=1 Tax=Roseivirga seohaensis TaxID=1914963 RepID=A0A150Y1S8_9BACT|nr:hypothetical protein [Roseivirga seohaensis]KYG84884.1 hypothetical protein AWW67_18025 [Roseivirga seohaensis]